MKVLHILNTLRPSGAETMLRLAAPYWLEKGLELSILATGEIIGPYSGELENAGFKILHLPFSKTFKFGFFFLKVLNDNNFDVVHIHTERAFFLYAIIAWALRTKTIISTIHSNHDFHGFIKIYRTIFRRLMHWIHVKQISISQSVYDTELHLYKNRTEIIKNWCDLDRFHPPTQLQKNYARDSLGINDCYALLAVGNCSPIKRHRLILEALPYLEKEKQKFVFLHVGEEESDYSERKMADSLSISSKVIFFGYQNDIRPYLWAADVFIMPSQYEGFSIAALEAIASGVPTLLVDVPGLSEWKEYGINSIYYTEPNPQKIANSILSILRSPNYPTNDQLEMIRGKFGVTRGANEYFNLYGQS